MTLNGLFGNYCEHAFFLGEALGAIGDPVVLDLLREYVHDPVIEVCNV